MSINRGERNCRKRINKETSMDNIGIDCPVARRRIGESIPRNPDPTIEGCPFLGNKVANPYHSNDCATIDFSMRSVPRPFLNHDSVNKFEQWRLRFLCAPCHGYISRFPNQWSNTYTVTLRIVGGDEKWSLKSETAKYGHESQGTRTRERLRWREPAADTKDRPILSSESSHKNKTVTVKE
jgi:hypothetical protein